jgi:hypothetical protein
MKVFHTHELMLEHQLQYAKLLEYHSLRNKSNPIHDQFNMLLSRFFTSLFKLAEWSPLFSISPYHEHSSARIYKLLCKISSTTKRKVMSKSTIMFFPLTFLASKQTLKTIGFRQAKSKNFALSTSTKLFLLKKKISLEFLDPCSLPTFS